MKFSMMSSLSSNIEEITSWVDVLSKRYGRDLRTLYSIWIIFILWKVTNILVSMKRHKRYLYHDLGDLTINHSLPDSTISNTQINNEVYDDELIDTSSTSRIKDWSKRCAIRRCWAYVVGKGCLEVSKHASCSTMVAVGTKM